MSNPGVRDITGSPDGVPNISDVGGAIQEVEKKLVTRGAKALQGSLPTNSQSELARIVVGLAADIFGKIAGNPTLLTNAIDASVANNAPMLTAQLKTGSESAALTELGRMRKVAAKLYKMEGEQKADRDLVHAIATDLLEGALALALAGVGL